MPAVIEELPSSSSEEDEHVSTPSPQLQHAPIVDASVVTTSAAEESAGAVECNVEECARLKVLGNQLYTSGKVSEALVEYRRALLYAPVKKVQPPPPAPGTEEAPASAETTAAPSASEPSSASAPPEDGEKETKEDEEEEPEDTTDYTTTAQVFCNAGLCLTTLGQGEEAVQMFSEAIRHDAAYQKAYLRRADCYYELEKWSNAFGDYENYEKLGGVLDASRMGRKTHSKAKVDEEMQKMLGELKNLGNRFLGMFGLSTDNFKFDKDPSSGSYSMRFEQ